MPQPRQILIVNDQPGRARQMQSQLRVDGFDVEVVPDGRQALRHLQGGAPCDALVVGLATAGHDSLDFCLRVRRLPHYTPVILTDAAEGELPRLLAWEMGADDCLAAHASMAELAARLKALLRLVDGLARRVGPPDSRIAFDDLSIDPLQRVVTVAGKPVALTHREFDLLHFLARQAGTVFSRQDLLRQVWGYAHDGYEHTVHTHVNRLRAKIEPDPTRPRRIVTAWGRGYKFAHRSD